ncbi:MAG TPA: SxtJ family membrane protein [Gemmatimonadales bacterium]|nr:SxtJ family membrane protein [Gemmatimonadales bacterium]
MTAADGRKFGLVLGAAFLALGALLWWRGRFPAAEVGGALGAALVAGAALIPTRLGPVQRVWMGFGAALSKVTSPIAMGILYFVVLTPVGVLRRAFGGNPLAHGAPDGSYWIARAADKRRSDLRRQF